MSNPLNIIGAVRAVRQLTRLQAITDPDLQAMIVSALREVDVVEGEILNDPPSGHTEQTWPMFKRFCIAQANLLEAAYREVNEYRANNVLRRN